jgi:hypothetical protein
MRIFPIIIIASVSFCPAQDIVVQGNSTQTDVFRATNSSTVSSDRIGVHGVSKPAPNWGIGIRGEGTYIGVQGDASGTGVGARYGGQFIAAGGDANFGVYGSADAVSGSYAGYFQGNVYISGTLTQASDLALKKNVVDIASPLAKLNRLKPKSYDLKVSEMPNMKLPMGKKYGFIAQEIESVYPELVHDVQMAASVDQKDGKSGAPVSYKSVDYIGLIPVLVSSIQAQQAQIESLKQEIESLRK